jgi:hypothetical protein
MVVPQAMLLVFLTSNWNLRSPVESRSYRVPVTSNRHGAVVLAPIGENPTS